MNSFKGHIESIKSEQSLSLVGVLCQNISFTAVVIDTPETQEYLEIGKEVNLLFKETEVVLALPPISEISLRNRIPGKVKNVEQGRILSKVEMDTPLGTLTSVITSDSLTRMKIQNGSELMALIKTNEIMLAP